MIERTTDCKMDDRDWCLTLLDRLSVAAVCPSLDLANEVRGLLAQPPAQMLTSEWVNLRVRARAWLDKVDAALPRFAGGTELRAAEAATPCMTPHWKRHEAEAEARREAIFADAEGRN